MAEKQAPLRRKRRKKSNGFGYILLFVVVFTSALFGISYIVKLYTPDVDVSIGNNETLTLSDSEIDTDIKTIDERLKWIQMEDEMPTVAIRNPKEEFNNENSKLNDKEIKKEKNKKEQNNNFEEMFAPRQPSPKIKKQTLDFNLNNNQVIEEENIPQIKTVSKVYIGNFYEIEDAIKIQHKISQEETDIVPFIKSINGVYIVQIGSFNDSEKANTLLHRMRANGYNAQIVTEN